MVVRRVEMVKIIQSEKFSRTAKKVQSFQKIKFSRLHLKKRTKRLKNKNPKRLKKMMGMTMIGALKLNGKKERPDGKIPAPLPARIGTIG